MSTSRLPALIPRRAAVRSSTFSHVLAIVQSEYMPAPVPAQRRQMSYHNGTALGRSSLRSHSSDFARRNNRSHLCRIVQSGHAATSGSGSGSRRCASSAHAYSSDVAENQHHHSELSSAPIYDPGSDHLAPSRFPRRPRRSYEPPIWASLPPLLNASLLDGSITSSSQFRAEFEKSACKSGQLANIDTMERVFRLWFHGNGPTPSEPSSWAWLSGQLGHMLASVSEAQGLFHPDVALIGNLMRACTLVKLEQYQEAYGIFSMVAEKTDFPSYRGRAIEHALRALILLDLRGVEAFESMDLGPGARAEFVKAVRKATKSSLVDSTDLTIDVFEEYARVARIKGWQGDLTYMIRYGGQDLRHLLVGNYDLRAQSPRFVAFVQDILVNITDPAHKAREWLTGPGNSPYLPRMIFNEIAHDPTRIDDAFGLFAVLRIEKPHLIDQYGVSLCLNLVKADEARKAHMVFANLVSQPKGISHIDLSRLLHASSYARGDQDLAVPLWEAIEKSFTPTDRDRLSMAKIHARRGNVKEVIAMLQQGNLDKSPYGQHILLELYARLNDTARAEECLDNIIVHEPRITAFNLVIRLHAGLADIVSAKRVFDRIRIVGLQPNQGSYVSMISAYAYRRDATSAQAVFDDMVDSGLEPDEVVWAALLNAEVESGQWAKVADRWSGLSSSVRQHVTVGTTFLKAFVLLGAPVDAVIQIFRSIRSPTEHAWALAMQSAFENGDTSLTQRLFSEMQARSESIPKTAPTPTAYSHSILLHCYIKDDNSERAHEVYEEMLKRNIVPSTISYGIIISSLVAKGPGAGFREAEHFADSIANLASSGRLIESRKGRGQINENLYGPLLVAAAKVGDAERAQIIFNQAVEFQGPSIVLLTQLLDAYRHADDNRSAWRVWHEIFDLACKVIPLAPQPEGGLNGRMRTIDNALILPVSIMLDVIAKQGNLTQIRELWNQVRYAGFGFDAGNFNHLATAIARKGDVEGAFQVVERVLMRPRRRPEEQRNAYNERMAQAPRTSVGHGSSVVSAASTAPVLEKTGASHEKVSADSSTDHRANTTQGTRAQPDRSVKPAATETVEGESPGRNAGSTWTEQTNETVQPLRVPNRRPDLIQQEQQETEKTLSALTYEGLVPLHSSSPTISLGSTADPGDPIHLLQTWRPQERLWRPTYNTVAILDQAYAQIEQGRTYGQWMALAQDESDADADADTDVRDDGGVMLSDFETPVRKPDGAINKTTPRALLMKLNKKYSRAVALVMLHRRKKKDMAMKRGGQQ